MKFKKILCAALSVTLLSAGLMFDNSFKGTLTAEAKATKSVSEMQKERSDAKANANKAKKEVERLKSEKASQEKILAAIVKKRNATQKEIDICNQQITKLKNEIAQHQKAIETNEKELSESKKLFADRIYAMYVNGGSGGLEILISADDFGDYLMKSELLDTISQHDNELLDEFAKKLSQVKTAKAAVEEKQSEQTEIYKQLAAKQSQIKSEYSEEAAVQSKIKDNLTDAEKDFKRYNDAVKQLDTDINSANQAAKSGNIKYSGGAFGWPVPGYYNVSSGYGYRNIFGGSSFHKGIDISSGGINGKTIVAAADGVVHRANFNNGGYGLYVVINHGSKDGKGYVTLYGHCSQLLVSAGQTVKKGQAIAKVGSTGRSTGPHLHFEVQIDGKHTNPMAQFK